MTIAVVVKVNDGYVLASDSATTMRKIIITPGNPPTPQLVTNIYNNANRPHSAHGELTPAEFALQWTTTHQPQAA